MSKKLPRHLLVLSTTTILTLLLSVPAFAAEGGSCLRDPSGAFVDAKGNMLSLEQSADCLNQLAPAAGDDDGGSDESGSDQNGDYDNDVPGTPSDDTNNDTPPPSEDTTGGDTPPDEDTTGDDTPPPSEDTTGDDTPPDENTTGDDCQNENNQPS
jgi:hypothetical protein